MSYGIRPVTCGGDDDRYAVEPASFSLLWDAAAAAWRVLGAPRGVHVI
jgi:hypothetical protein